jgi:hypothetical protein
VCFDDVSQRPHTESFLHRQQKIPDSRRVFWIPGYACESVEQPQLHSTWGVRRQVESDQAAVLPLSAPPLVHCAYIRMIPTPTGRKIVFVTNRQIRFAEAWADSQSMSFDLTAGIVEINDQDKSKSTGVLYPLAQLVLDKQGELEWDLNQNPWKLVDILDWKGTPGVN